MTTLANTFMALVAGLAIISPTVLLFAPVA
jgi:hypothetical protein